MGRAYELRADAWAFQRIAEWLNQRAPVEKLQAYKERMGWNIDWVSTAGSDFNRDLGFTHTEEELRPFLEARSRQA